MSTSTPVQRDHALALAAVAKIVAAQRRGTISSTLRVSYEGGHVNVGRLKTSADRAWFEKNYPTHETLPGGFIRPQRKRRGQELFDFQEIRHLLREKDPVKHHYDIPPRVSYETTTPHVHKNLNGQHHQSWDAPRWRCWSCGHTLTKTEARELGLIPLLVRKAKP